MGALQNLEKGQIKAALMDIVNSIESEVESLETQFPFLATFIAQFDSQVGQAVLTEVEAIAPTTTASNFVANAETVAAKVASDLGADAVGDVKTLALNALRAATTVIPATPAVAA